MSSDALVNAVARWFEHDFPCRRYVREKELQTELKTALGQWIQENYPDWKLQNGQRKFIRLFGWWLETDLELRHSRTRAVIPIELKLSKKNYEYTVLHAMGQALYCSQKTGKAIALVVDAGRGDFRRSPHERKLLVGLWEKLGVRLCVKKVD